MAIKSLHVHYEGEFAIIHTKFKPIKQLRMHLTVVRSGTGCSKCTLC
jgi:hypothetical protein